MLRLSRTLLLLVLAGLVFLAPGTAHATNYSFTGLAATCPFSTQEACATFVPGDPENWGDVRNWSPQGVPSAADTVSVGNFPVNLNGTRSVQRLTMNGTGLLRNGTLNLSGPAATFLSAWTSGTIGCTLNIVSGASLRISGSAEKIASVGPINNSGTVTWINDGVLRLNDNAVFNNKSGGVFNAQNNSGVLFSSFGGVFNNLAGSTFNKSGAGTTTTFGVLQPFNNAGTVNVSSGTLALTEGASSGVFQPSSGAVVDFISTYTFNSGTKFRGTGCRNTGTATFNGTVLVEDGGTFAMPSGVVLGTSTSNLTTAGTGFYHWTGGTISATGSILNIGAGAQFRISGSAEKIVRNGVVNNSGIVTWLNNGVLRLNDSAVFNNKSGGVFNAQNNSGVFFSSFGGSFNNLAGATFNKSGAGTTTTFGILQAFSNTGTVNVDSGTLTLDGGGSSSGIFNTANGARTNVSGNLSGTLKPVLGGVIGIGSEATETTLRSGLKCLGAGLCKVFAGTVSVTGTTTVGSATEPGTLEFEAGRVTGTASGNLLTAGSGLYNWTGTLIGANDSIFNIGAGAQFRISGGGEKQFRNGVINNSGTITWLNNGVIRLNDSAVFNNKSGGVFNAQNNSGVFFSSFGGVFNNLAGATFNKSGAGTTTTFGVLQPFNNAGTVNVSSGKLSFDSDFKQTGGATVLKGGDIAASASFAIQGGVLSGNGTVTGNIANSGGQVSPGLSAPGAIAESGDYTQSVGGDLRFQLNGITPVTQYDQLNVSGTVALSGSLTLSAGFAPPSGTAFTIINNAGTDAVTGTFSGLSQGASVAAGSALFRINYAGGDGNDVVLTSINPTLVISDVAVTEGSPPSSGAPSTKNMVFTVTLSEALSQNVMVNYITANGTAVAPGDYASVTGTLTFSAGQTVKTVVVLVVSDKFDENNETLFLDLKNATLAKIADSRGIGTINDDDAAPAVSIADAVPVTEANTNAVFTVTLSAASGKTVTVNYATANGTAAAPGDYTATNGTLSFAPGETSKAVNMAVKSDLQDEANETFTVNLSNPVNATLADAQGTGTILDDDGPAIIITNPASVTEGNSSSVNAVFTVTLSAPSAQTVTVRYSTADFTATAGSDYTARSSTLSFAPGETSKTIAVPILGDTLIEGNEVLLVNLSVPTNANIADGTGAVYILDDDVAALLFEDDAPSE